MAANTKLKPDARPASRTAVDTTPGKTHTDQLDNLIHERSRLALVSALAVHDSLSFSELKELLQMSDGNLSVQARKLEEAGYLQCNKQFIGRMPRTDYSLTARGRAALQRYISHMEALIGAMDHAASLASVKGDSSE